MVSQKTSKSAKIPKYLGSIATINASIACVIKVSWSSLHDVHVTCIYHSLKFNSYVHELPMLRRQEANCIVSVTTLNVLY